MNTRNSGSNLNGSFNAASSDSDSASPQPALATDTQLALRAEPSSFQTPGALLPTTARGQDHVSPENIQADALDGGVEFNTEEVEEGFIAASSSPAPHHRRLLDGAPTVPIEKSFNGERKEEEEKDENREDLISPQDGERTNNPRPRKANRPQPQQARFAAGAGGGPPDDNSSPSDSDSDNSGRHNSDTDTSNESTSDEEEKTRQALEAMKRALKARRTPGKHKTKLTDKDKGKRRSKRHSYVSDDSEYQEEDQMDEDLSDFMLGAVLKKSKAQRKAYKKSRSDQAKAKTHSRDELLTTLVTEMRHEQAKSYRAQKKASKLKEMELFQADAIPLGGAGVHDKTEWISHIEAEAGSLMAHKDFIVRLRPLFTNELATDFMKPETQVGSSATTTLTNYLQVYINITQKQKYRDLRQSINLEYSTWKDEVEALDELCQQGTLHSTELIRHISTKPSYVKLWTLFKTCLVTNDQSLEAKQHRESYPSLDTSVLKELRFRQSDKSRTAKGNKEIVEKADTWESFVDRWETYAAKQKSGKYGSHWETETGVHGYVHTFYEMLPSKVRQKVENTIDAYPSNEKEWSFEYLSKIIRPYLESGTFQEDRRAANVTNRLASMEKSIKAVEVNGVGGDWKGGGGRSKHADTRNNSPGTPRAKSRNGYHQCDGLGASKQNGKDAFRDLYIMQKGFLVDGQSVPGKDGRNMPYNLCYKGGTYGKGCGAHGHLPHQCPGNIPSGTRQEIGTDLDSRHAALEPLCGPCGVTVNHVSKKASKKEKSDANGKLLRGLLKVAGITEEEALCAPIIDVNLIGDSKALYTETLLRDDNHQVVKAMQDSGAAVMFLVGTKVAGWLLKQGCVVKQPKTPDLNLRSVSGDGLEYSHNLYGYLPFKDGRLTDATFLVCKNVKPTTLIVGNCAFIKYGAKIDYTEKEMEYTFPDGVDNKEKPHTEWGANQRPFIVPFEATGKRTDLHNHLSAIISTLTRAGSPELNQELQQLSDNDPHAFDRLAHQFGQAMITRNAEVSTGSVPSSQMARGGQNLVAEEMRSTKLPSSVALASLPDFVQDGKIKSDTKTKSAKVKVKTKPPPSNIFDGFLDGCVESGDESDDDVTTSPLQRAPGQMTMPESPDDVTTATDVPDLQYSSGSDDSDTEEGNVDKVKKTMTKYGEMPSDICRQVNMARIGYSYFNFFTDSETADQLASTQEVLISSAGIPGWYQYFRQLSKADRMKATCQAYDLQKKMNETFPEDTVKQTVQRESMWAKRRLPGLQSEFNHDAQFEKVVLEQFEHAENAAIDAAVQESLKPPGMPRGLSKDGQMLSPRTPMPLGRGQEAAAKSDRDGSKGCKQMEVMSPSSTTTKNTKKEVEPARKDNHQPKPPRMKVISNKQNQNFLAAVTTMALIVGATCTSMLDKTRFPTFPECGPLLDWDLQRFANAEDLNPVHAIDESNGESPTLISRNSTHTVDQFGLAQVTTSSEYSCPVMGVYSTKDLFLLPESEAEETSLDDNQTAIRAVDKWFKSNEGRSHCKEYHHHWDIEDDPILPINSRTATHVNYVNEKASPTLASVKSKIRSGRMEEGANGKDKVPATYKKMAQIDALIADRMSQRGLAFIPEIKTEDGLLVGAAIHDTTEDAPLWDQMDLAKSKWALRNRPKLEAVLIARKELFNYKAHKPPFTKPDGTPFEVKIELINDTPAVTRAWRLAPEKLKVLDKHIDTLLESKVIYPTDDSNYSAVTVLVKKPGRTNELRVTTDYRKLNHKCKKYAFMTPTASELFNMTAGATTFSTIDVHSAFYAMQVRKADQHKLAFSTPHRGMFTYNRMPQGWINSPQCWAAGCQKMLMAKYDGPGPMNGRPCHEFCAQFVDDLLIYSTDEYHLDYIAFILKLLEKHNLSLRPDKCFLGQPSVKYLGVTLSAEGLKVDQDKVLAMRQAPKPTDPAGVRRFYGAASFMRQWIPKFAERTASITNLLKKDIPWNWSQKCDEEYEDILTELTEGKCLAVFDWGKDVILRCDASGIGYGACIWQQHGKQRRLVACASKRLNECESKRCARDLECGCQVWACQKFRPMLLHRKFLIEGDHAPLLYLSKYQGNNRRLFNYSLILSDYDFVFKYKKGETMADADWLSRHPGPLLKNDPHDPDAKFDPEGGTDLVRNHIGNATVPNHATEAPISHVKIDYRELNKGNTSQRIASMFKNHKEATAGTSPFSQIDFNPGKIDQKRAARVQAARRRLRGGLKPNTAAEDPEETKFQNLEPYTPKSWTTAAEVSESSKLKQPPYSEVIADDLVFTRTHIHDKEELGPPEVDAKKPKLGWHSPDWTPRWHNQSAGFVCGKNCPCCRHQQKVKTGKATFYACPVCWNEHNKPRDDSALRPSMPVPTPSNGEYNLVSVNAGIGGDSMALENNIDFTVRAVIEADPDFAEVLRDRTKLVPHPTLSSWWHKYSEPETPEYLIDVLSYTHSIEHNHLDVLLDVAKRASPRVIVIQVPQQVLKNPLISNKLGADHIPARKVLRELESKLNDMQYTVDTNYINSAEVGGTISQTSYYCVAHRTGAVAIRWPEPLDKFGGIDHILSENVDRRHVRDSYKALATPPPEDVFRPYLVGLTQGGEQQLGTNVWDHQYPLAPSSKFYNRLTRSTGAGCIRLESDEVRSLTQEEQMRGYGFTETVTQQLANYHPVLVQQALSESQCVITRGLVLEGILELLSCTKVNLIRAKWGYVEEDSCACHEPHMPVSTYILGAIAAGQCQCETSGMTVNGVLRHTVMPSFREIREAQQKDADLSKLAKFIAQRDSKEPQPGVKDKAQDVAKLELHVDYRKDADYFHMSNGAIMHRDILNDEWLTDCIVLPPTQINTAMEAFHDSGYGGHLGAFKTRVAMQERIWFPRLRKRIQTYVDNCGTCKVSKAQRRSHAGEMKSSLYCDQFEDWAVDLQGPYLESTDGNLYHLHLVDLATNWNVSVALPNKQAKTVADAIHKHLILSGPTTCPKTILSDLGTEFTAELTGELFKQFGIRHLKCTASHPTGNAVCERQHRTYNSIMRTFLHKYGREWDESLPYACFCINTHAIAGTNISPYELVYGRKPEDPNTVSVQDRPLWGKKTPQHFMSPAEHIKLKRARLDDVMEQVNLQRLQVIRQNQSLLRKVQYSHKYHVGDLVLRWTANPKIGTYGKLAYKCTGPYEVVGICPQNPNVYELIPLGREDKDPSKHHVREICPYITKEAHEKQDIKDIDQDHEEILQVQIGDYLLLPYSARRDLFGIVRSVDGNYATVQYLSKTEFAKDPMTKVNLVWFRQNPTSTEEDVQEIYKPTLTAKQLKEGWKPWEETVHLHLFYQRIVKSTDIKIEKDGITIKPLRKAAIKKAKALVPV